MSVTFYSFTFFSICAACTVFAFAMFIFSMRLNLVVYVLFAIFAL